MRRHWIGTAAIGLAAALLGGCMAHPASSVAVPVRPKAVRVVGIIGGSAPTEDSRVLSTYVGHAYRWALSNGQRAHLASVRSVLFTATVGSYGIAVFRVPGGTSPYGHGAVVAQHGSQTWQAVAYVDMPLAAGTQRRSHSLLPVRQFVASSFSAPGLTGWIYTAKSQVLVVMGAAQPAPLVAPQEFHSYHIAPGREGWRAQQGSTSLMSYVAGSQLISVASTLPTARVRLIVRSLPSTQVFLPTEPEGPLGG